jgi:hypothetical protein
MEDAFALRVKGDEARLEVRVSVGYGGCPWVPMLGVG